MSSNKFLAFYKVDLVCNVVSSIGCGSRSKPILLELENEGNIAESKLNRKGDTLAIRWINKDITSRSVIIASIFSKFDIVVQELDENENKQQLNSFLKEDNNWLDARQIDQLSREEAKTVANQLIAVYESEIRLSSQQKSKLEADIEAIFFDFFLNFESMQQLSDTNIYRNLVIEVIESSKSYLNSNETPEIELLLNAIGGHYENNDQTKCCN